MIYLGVDTGMLGAVAAISAFEARVWPMPVLSIGERRTYNTRELAVIFRDALAGFGKLEQVALVAVERLAGFPPGTNAAAIQAAAAGPALFEGMCAALELPFRLVYPQEWQSAMLSHVPRPRKAASDDPKARDAARRDRRRTLKAVAVADARRLFPDVCLMASERSRVPSDGMAEALLLAEFAKRIHTGGELFAAADRSQASAMAAEPEDVFQ